MLGYSEEGLENPVTIQDKLRWLNIYDADPLKSDCADKLKVKEYAKKITGVDLGVPTIAVWDKAEDIDFSVLPNKFIIKCNHGSWMNIIVKDKNQLNENKIKKELNKWLSIDFTFKMGFESHYHWIERKIFAELLIGDGSRNLKDYKFWCFNGEPQFWTINDGNGHGDIMYYHMDGSEWNLYQVQSHDDYIKPETFDLMVNYSRQLSKNFKFVRVDFYEIEGKPLLGEMTFTPGACIFKYKKPEDEIKIGNMLDLKDKEQYIVSLTSYPARIQYAAEAVKSLLKQKADVEYKVVLVLAEPQFPGCKTPKEIQSLLKDRRFEILWHPTDIRSHKKLIPTLNKYSDATIIITDDDITRPDWWLQMFIDDHKKYPEDVIVGLSAWRLNKDMKQVGAARVRPKNYMFPCVTKPEMILLTERPANGLGGVLYPKHTFKRTEFFDEVLFMKLSPYSDESWQYCFNVIENKTLRLCSNPTDWSKFLIKGSQNTALSKHNSFSEYVRLYKLLMDEFPEYKENMIHRLEAYGTPVRLTTTKEDKKATPEVICQLNGRLGNILFEIASASYYAKQHNMPIKYYFIQESGTDYDYFKRCSINNILKEPIELVSKKYALNSSLPVFDVPKEKSSITYTEMLYVSGKNIHITGNRQSEKYFTKQYARDMFDFSAIDKEVERLYGKLSDTAAIHIRRTDYVEPKRWYRSVTEEDVFTVREMFPDDEFIIFSDDIEWCKEKFDNMNFRFAVKNDSKYDDSLIEFAAMRQCMALIMSNSTFSWWAAYLSERPGHMTVYKKPWFTYDSECDIIPNDNKWMTFDEFLEINII